MMGLARLNPTEISNSPSAAAGRATTTPATSDYVFQAKTLFRPLETNDSGIGFRRWHHQASGNQFRPEHAGQYLRLHPAIGFAERRQSHSRQSRLAERQGIRPEQPVMGCWRASSNCTPDCSASPKPSATPSMSTAMSGVRYSVRPDLFQVDATIGQQLSGPGKTIVIVRHNVIRRTSCFDYTRLRSESGEKAALVVESSESRRIMPLAVFQVLAGFCGLF